MLGFQEILIIILVVLGFIVFRPLFSKRPVQRKARPTIEISGKWRLALVASVVYPAAVAVYIQPWQNDPIIFYYIGVGPVVLAWLLGWAVMGFKKRS